MKLSVIAARLGARLDGADAEITGVAGIEAAQAGQLTFVANPKYAPAAKTTHAAAIIVAEDFPALATPTLRTKNPYLAFAKAIELFYQPPQYAPGVHPTTVVHPTAKIGKGAHIGPYVTVDANAELGENATLLAHVAIYQGVKVGRNFFAHAHSIVREHCEIGDNVILQNGVVIGGDGFGFAKDDAGKWHKIVQSGRVVIASNVEVQSNACVDRAAVGETRVAAGVKIDNLVQVGHGSTVGEDSLLCAQVGLAGSTELGKNVVLAGQAGVAGHCKLGDGVVVTAQSGTHGDIPAGMMVSGSPAFEHRQWLRAVTAFAKLPELMKKLRGKSKE